MKYISVDIEADGPCPGLYSMVALGAVVVDDEAQTFYTEIRPVTMWYQDGALNACGFTREQTLTFTPAEEAMQAFGDWLQILAGMERILFVSDNAGFDWQFVNYYLHKYYGSNRFGFSPFSLTSFYKGYAKSMRASFKHLRTHKHTHNALDDALGNAGALSKLLQGMK